jgi:lipopolysaccharide transport system permease protein
MTVPTCDPSFAADANDRRPLLVIKPPSRWAPLRLREVWEFRELAYRFMRRDLTLRYRQTALGVIWVIAQPLLGAGVFSFVFGRVARLSTDGIPYFVFAYAGMLAWNLFSSIVTRVSGSLLSNQALVSKIFFPRLALPLSSVGSSTVDFVAGAVVMGVILLRSHLTPGAGLLCLPVWSLLLGSLALGVGLICAALAVSYRDVSYMVPVALQLMLYGSPIAYASRAVPAGLRWATSVNPLTGLIDGYRWSLLGAPAPTVHAAVWSAAAAAVALTTGLCSFARLERRFADVI